MNAVGIDMSKDTFHACFDTDEVEIFENTKRGIKKFISRLGYFSFGLSDTTIGVEATGAYHLLFAETLRKKEWNIVVINPLLTSRLNKTSLRNVKTDRADARSIRQAVILGYGYRYTDTPDILRLKTLVQERLGLKRMHTECLQRRHAHSYKARAVDIPVPDCFQSVEANLSREIKALERQIAAVVPEIQKLLRSIPGVGALSAACLVAYVGDINRFESPEKLTAYLGLDCRVHESGTSVHGKGYLTKRGNKYLRATLFNAAFVAQKRNPELKKFYDKKIKEGKHHFVALCAVERKLVHLIFAIWKRGTPFEYRPLKDSDQGDGNATTTVSPPDSLPATTTVSMTTITSGV
jgi:transposase